MEGSIRLPEQFEHLENGIDRRAARSSSFVLSNMLDQAGIKTLIQLQPQKRFLAYDLPQGSHLIFKSLKGS